MKHKLSLFLLAVVLAMFLPSRAMAQPPYVRNALDTNALSLDPLDFLLSGGVFSLGVNPAITGTFTAGSISSTQLNLTGAGVGRASFYDAAGTEYFQLEAPSDILTSSVLRLPTNAIAGVMVAQPTATGTNQWVFIPLTAGQYVTYNGTTYVASNTPSGAGGSPGGSTTMLQMNLAGAFAGTTNLVYDVVNGHLSMVAGTTQFFFLSNGGEVRSVNSIDGSTNFFGWEGIGTRTTSPLYIKPGGVAKWQFDPNGYLLPPTTPVPVNIGTNGRAISTIISTNFQQAGLLQTNRVPYFDSTGRLTNVTSASPSTDYVHADGSVDSGSGGISSATATNISVSRAGTETWINVLDYGADPTGAADSTMAISNALWVAVQPTNHATATTIYFPARGPMNAPAIYRVSGGTNFPERTQLLLSRKETIGGTSSNFSYIRLLGPSAPVFADGSGSPGVHGWNGSTIFSTITNEGASVIASEFPTNLNQVTLYVENIGFKTMPDFRGTVLNLTNVGNVKFSGVSVLHSNSTTGIPSQPLSGSTAIDLPRSGMGGFQRLEDVNVVGYNYGIKFGEHTTAGRLLVIACSNGVVFKGSVMGNTIESLYVASCSWSIYAEGISTFDINSYVNERSGTTDWKSNTWDYVDSGTGGSGTINWKIKDLLASGGDHKPRVSGGQNVNWIEAQFDPLGTMNNSQSTVLWKHGPHHAYVDNSTRYATMTLMKTRGTFDTPLTVTATDIIGGYSWAAFDGTTMTNTGNYIFGQVEGTVSQNTIPTAISFWTGTNLTVSSEKMRIKSDGKVGIGATAPIGRLGVSNHEPALVGMTVDQISTAGADIARFRAGNVSALVVATNGVIATNNWAVFAPVTTNIFVLGTRYTNTSSRAFLAASVQLTAAAAGTSKVSLYVEHGTTITNSVSASAGPLAALVTVEQLSLLVPPGGFYYFTDETSGAGASAAIVGDKCSITSF